LKRGFVIFFSLPPHPALWCLSALLLIKSAAACSFSFASEHTLNIVAMTSDMYHPTSTKEMLSKSILDCILKGVEAGLRSQFHVFSELDQTSMANNNNWQHPNQHPVHGPAAGAALLRQLKNNDYPPAAITAITPPEESKLPPEYGVAGTSSGGAGRSVVQIEFPPEFGEGVRSVTSISVKPQSNVPIPGLSLPTSGSGKSPVADERLPPVLGLQDGPAANRPAGSVVMGGPNDVAQSPSLKPAPVPSPPPPCKGHAQADQPAGSEYKNPSPAVVTTNPSPTEAVAQKVPLALPTDVVDDVVRGPNEVAQPPSLEPAARPLYKGHAQKGISLPVSNRKEAAMECRRTSFGLLQSFGVPVADCNTFASLALTDWDRFCHSIDVAITWSVSPKPPKLTEYVVVCGLRGRAKKLAFAVALALRKRKTMHEAWRRAAELLQLIGPDGNQYTYSFPPGGEFPGVRPYGSSIHNQKRSSHLIHGDSASPAGKEFRMAVGV
jgi:hypothetical protein